MKAYDAWLADAWAFHYRDENHGITEDDYADAERGAGFVHIPGQPYGLLGETWRVPTPDYPDVDDEPTAAEFYGEDR